MDDSRIQAMRDNRVYISGSITGTDDYMERFSKAEKELEAQGFGVINPAKVNAQLPADITTYVERNTMIKAKHSIVKKDIVSHWK